MMTLDLKKLRLVAEAATPGPWRQSGANDNFVIQTHHTTRDVWSIAECTHNPSDDAEHIAAFNPTVTLALIAEIERLQGNLKHIHRHTKESWCQGYCLNALEGDT